MVLPDSHRVPRAPRYLGVSPGRLFRFAYGAITRYGPTFQPVLLQNNFVTSRGKCSYPHEIPQPRPYNASTLTYDRFGLIPVRSPLLGESLLISFPEGTEMFQFPSFASFRI